MNALVPNANLPQALQDYLRNQPMEDDLGAGITGGFAVLSYKGKNWHTRFRGDETLITRNMVLGDGSNDPAASIQVVILKASPHISKVFYEKGFVDGDMSPPDCWSTHGTVPDPAAVKKQATACLGCPKNVIGSKITDNGKKAKACSDSKRLAVVPLSDIDNAIFNGPMLLRTPAASLQEVRSYSTQLNQKGIPYFAVGTSVSFDTSEAFPKLLFAPVRTLTNAEIQKVIDLRADERVARILDEAVESGPAPVAAAAPAAAAPAPAADPFANLGPLPSALAGTVTPEVIEATAVSETQEQKDFREFQEAKRAKAEAAARAAAEAAAAAAAVPAKEETEEEREFREFREAKAAAAAAAAPAATTPPKATRTSKPKADAAPAAPAAPAATGTPVSFDNLLDGLLPT